MSKPYFDYRVPETLEPVVDVGSRVLVPFGGRRVQGFVLEVTDETDVQDCKNVLAVTEDEPLLPYDLLEVAKVMSEMYACPLAACVRCMLPSGMRIEGERRAELLVESEEGMRVLLERLGSARAHEHQPILLALAVSPRTVGELARALGDRTRTLRCLRTLESEGLVRVSDVWTPPRVRERIEMRLFVEQEQADGVSDVSQPGLTDLQQRVVESIRRSSGEMTVAECARACGCTPSVVHRAVEKGAASVRPTRVMRRPAGSGVGGYGAVTLNAEQERVVAAIHAAVEGCLPQVFLLRGVTGSGKTEVYLRAIRKVVDEGREAIVLVPEISLTPQTVSRFRERFGDAVAVLHSRLSPGERFDEWVRIRSGQVSVVVGARSAVFAPFSNLGLIVVDEEHEPSYKQDDDPKYHAVEVALARSEISGVPVVLGSATPSIESSQAALEGRYELLQLTERVDSRPMPPVTTVDMREELRAGNRSVFSRALREGLEGTLQRGEQAVIFLNRRGFSTFVMCRECGHVMACDSCDVSLTFHANPPILQCHYCNANSKVPTICPKCGSRYIKYFGAGTQKIEAELQGIFASARIIRMDVDTTSGKDSHARLLDQFARGDADILVGTQMIAKGLDFPNVTLVGVIAADTSLNFPDYRAAERTFQLLTQVAGRAGRGVKPGIVVVQTYNPDHYAVECAAGHDYDTFFNREIEVRRSLDLPPFVEMAQIVISGTDEAAVIVSAREVAEALRGLAESRGAQVLGPAPAPISKIEGRYRWHVLLKAETLEQLTGLLKAVPSLQLSPGKAADSRFGVTIRPVNLL